MFAPFPKIPRLARDCIITEKLDGTNAQVIVSFKDPEPAVMPDPVAMVLTEVGPVKLWAGSRTRLIFPGKTTDNFGFAAWVAENATELVKLGDGHHYGEWYGQGIQRGYGLTEKRFALFNAMRWGAATDRPACCEVVPTLYTGPFCTEQVRIVMGRLDRYGSVAVPGFNNPEGIIVYHTAARTMFKQTFDDNHKEAA